MLQNNYIFILLFSVYQTFGLIENFIEPDTNIQIETCHKILIRKYFRGSEYLSGSVVSVNIYPKFINVQDSILKMLHENIESSVTVKLVTEDLTLNDIDIKERIRNYLIFVLELEELTEIIDDLRTFPSWNSLAQVVVVFLNVSDNDELEWEAIDEIKIHFLNVNIISQRNNSVQCLTSFPYGYDNCNDNEDIKLDLIDECEVNGVEEDSEPLYTELLPSDYANKFPKKLRGCPITVAARAWEPFTYYNDHNVLYAGIDLMIMKTISEIMDVNTKIYLDNRTLYHVFQSVIEKEIHLIIGGVDEDPSLSQLISTSIPYHQDDLTWCVAVAARTVFWLGFLQLFDGITWILVAISILSLALGLFYSGNLFKERKGLFKIISAITATLINQSPDIESSRLSVRMLAILVFIFSLVINTAYQSFLISSITHPIQAHQVSSVEDLYKNSFFITGKLETLRHLTKEDKVTSYLRKKLIICNSMEECLIVASVPNSVLAVAASREHVFYNPRIPRDKLFCFPTSRNIYSYFISFITTKQNHLIVRINSIIQQIIESGHIIKWTRDIDNERTLRDQMLERNIESNVRLNMDQLKGPFIFSGILVIISISVFLFELFIYKKFKSERKLKVKRFWYNFHMKFKRL